MEFKSIMTDILNIFLISKRAIYVDYYVCTLQWKLIFDKCLQVPLVHRPPVRHDDPAWPRGLLPRLKPP